MNTFREIKPEQLDINPFQAIGHEWMLITAANSENQNGAANPMTASWGGMGVLFGFPVAFAFIRPQRFTEPLVDKADTFSLTFFDEAYREQLNICGSKSGRDINKLEVCGFDLLHDGETPYIAQAHTAILCRKVYRQQLEPQLFTDQAVNQRVYPGNDHHFLYVGEITKVLVKA